MPNLKQTEEGFTLADVKKNELTIAFLSLRSAFRAWFSTYQSLGWNLEFKQVRRNKHRAHSIKYTEDYFEQYSETIFHFHHFIELILKDILQINHQFFSDTAKRNINLERIKYSVMLKKFVELVTDGELNQEKYGFVKEEALSSDNNGGLGYYRNRLAHRGIFVLNYFSLDEFIVIKLLPIVLLILKLPEYKEHEKIWKYQKLFSKIDPLTMLGQEFSQGNVDFRKIALLKELGRAAYRNPLKKGKMIDFFGVARAKNSAKEELENGGAPIDKIFHCPICGNESLVRFYEYVTHDPEDEDLMEHTKIKCYGCTFELYNNLGEISAFDLGLENFWQPDNSDLRPS